MARLTLALLCAAGASACNSYSSGAAEADLLDIGLHTASDVASDDCESPRTSWHPIGAAGAGPGGVPAARLAAVAFVYRNDPPRRPYTVIGTVRARIASADCEPDLIFQIRGRATSQGCDAVVIGDRRAEPGGGAVQDGSCLVFAR
ncbi:MAG TPA: hypothetical protein VK698_24150 [Kofleriaceae bacterium]|nr:hypothetical protein [Kofleriaceae bacterium]